MGHWGTCSTRMSYAVRRDNLEDVVVSGLKFVRHKTGRVHSCKRLAVVWLLEPEDRRIQGIGH